MIKLLAPWGELQPVERDVIGFKSTFGKRPNLLAFNTETLTLKNDDFVQVMQHIQTIGRFQDIPVTVQGDNFTGNYILSLRGAQKTLNSITVSIRPRKGNLTFFERADALTFESLNFLNALDESTFVEIPYLVVKPDLVLQSLIVSFTIYSLSIEIARTIKEIADLTAQGTNVLAPQVAILQGIILAVYLAVLIATLVLYVIELKRLFFPKLRYFKAMRDYDLIRQGCEHLGYTLQSDLLENQLRKIATLPIPLTRDLTRKSIFDFIPDELSNDVFNYGYPTSQDTVPTLGALIEQIETIYNAETHIYNGVVQIETRQTFIQNPIATLPSVFNDQSNNTNVNAWDEENVWKRKLLSWQIDYSDAHTTDNFNGLGTEKSTEAIVVTEADLVNYTGFKSETFNFALGRRKTKLTTIEKLVRGLFVVVDGFANFLGGNSALAQGVADRVGVLMISEETFSVTKKLWINDDGRQPQDYIGYLNALFIYEWYHKDQEVSVNDGEIYDSMPIPCTQFEFQKFAQNKYVNLQGTTDVVQLLEANYNDDERKAIVSFKKFTGASNTKITTVF
jgi:hypothetical protein